MKINSRVFYSIFNFFIIVFVAIICTPEKLESQTGQFDTIYQTNKEIIWLRTSNGYTSWFESTNGVIGSYFRLHDENLESRNLEEIYSSCNSFKGLFIYDDFFYVKINDDNSSELCNRGFIWGENAFIQDTFNIKDICAQHERFLYQGFGNDTLIDIATNTKKKLNLENAQFNYSSGNICSLNDSIANIKVGKHEKNTNAYLGDAIIQYNWKTDQLKEIFFSNNFIHFRDEHPTSNQLAFTEEHASGNLDSMKLFYYDGEGIQKIAQKYIINGFAYPYLDGVVYNSADSLFYWEDGFTALLSEKAFRVNFDKCKISWDSRDSGNSGKLKFYNGSKYVDFEYEGYLDLDFSFVKFNSDTSFIVPFTGLDNNNKYILEGRHELSCISDCAYPDIQILENEKRSFLKTTNITSQAVIDNGNVIYKSSNSIRLLPGFKVEKGQQFIAKIESCTSNALELITNDNLNLKNHEESLKHIQSDELGNNYPNPFFNGTTKVKYYISENSKTAKLKVYNLLGQVINNVEIKTFGNGELEIVLDANKTSTYITSLEVDGRIIGSIKMTSIK